MELLRGVDGVLAGHGVSHEENLLRVEELLEPLHLAHQILVDVQAAGGIHDQRVEAEVARFAPRLCGEPFNECRAGGLALGVALVDLRVDGLGNDFELLARGRAVDVDRDEDGAVAALLEPRGQFAGCGRFSGALQSGHQDHRRRLRGELEARRVAAEQLDQLVPNDLDDLFGGRKGSKHLGANGLHADVLDEVLDDVEVHVGFEQCNADLAQSFGDVFFGQRALASKGLEGALQLVCKGLEHRFLRVPSTFQCTVTAASGSPLRPRAP